MAAATSPENRNDDAVTINGGQAREEVDRERMDDESVHCRQRTPENEVEEGGGREKGEGDEKKGVWGR